MQPGPGVKQRKAVWLLIVFAIAISPLLLLAIKLLSKSNSVVQPPPPPPDPVYFSVAAGLLLLMAIWWTLSKVRPKQEVGGEAELVPAATFQTNSIIALALSEAAAIMGFVAAPSGHGSMMIPFVGGSLVVILFVILPSGVAYWRLKEERGE